METKQYIVHGPPGLMWHVRAYTGDHAKALAIADTFALEHWCHWSNSEVEKMIGLILAGDVEEVERFPETPSNPKCFWGTTDPGPEERGISLDELIRSRRETYDGPLLNIYEVAARLKPADDTEEGEPADGAQWSGLIFPAVAAYSADHARGLVWSYVHCHQGHRNPDGPPSFGLFLDPDDWPEGVDNIEPGVKVDPNRCSDHQLFSYYEPEGEWVQL